MYIYDLLASGKGVEEGGAEGKGYFRFRLFFGC